jgi:acetyl esterase/lipase
MFPFQWAADVTRAPEYKFPYAINDCFDVLTWCKSNATEIGINPEKIIVAGGSAGGNIVCISIYDGFFF